MKDYDFLLSNINIIKGIGSKTTKLFKKKNINTVFDLIWSLPRNFTDRSVVSKINELLVGRIQTIVVNVEKYSFPRIRNLPNKVICHDETGKIECVFFNSYEGYIRKILPLKAKVTINGKISYYKNKYQIINPTHVSSEENRIIKFQPNYSLTDGLNDKKYISIINYVLNNLPDLKEWHNKDILKKFKNISWKQSVIQLHDPKNINKKGNFLYRLIFDEILSVFLTNSKIRKAIKKIKKEKKKFKKDSADFLIKKLNYNLTKDQLKSIDEINFDLESNQKMFRILQGDVGSGKTIVSLITAMNVISSGFQVALMAPTEILAQQHLSLANTLFEKKINIKLLTSKTDYKDRKNIINNLAKKNIDLIIGTHSLFQEKVKFKRLGLIVIDEQHKFGVKQRKKLSDKGGNNCDILAMSATPIPRTMIMTVFGDMDTSIIKTKPSNRKDVITYSKPETKIDEVIKFVKSHVDDGNQVFWVCPLIEESKKIDHQSSIKRYEFLKKIFKNKVGLLHGAIDKEKKKQILHDFLKKEIHVLVSTTVIEVGIDFPNATVIVIENANKFGLSQLHQLRGRVGRGIKQSYCILMFKSTLSENAKKRINILKKNNDGFKISEEDMKLRGYGDLLGFKQSGLQTFRLADPVLNEDLFNLAEKEIKKIESENHNLDNYNTLLKLYDRADILNDII